MAEALAAPRTVEGRHGLPEAVDRPTIVALGLVGLAEGRFASAVQDNIPTGRGERQGTLGGGDGLVIARPATEMDCQKDRDLSQPTRVIEGLRKGFGLAQGRQDTPKVARADRSAERRASRRSMACSCVSRVSGRCGRALSACSKYPAASR